MSTTNFCESATTSNDTESALHLFSRLKAAQLRTGLEPLDRLVKFSPGQIQYIKVRFS